MRDHSRRQFVVRIGAFTITGVALNACRTTGAGSAVLAEPRGAVAARAATLVRRDIAALSESSPEVVAYRKAIAAMKKLEGDEASWVTFPAGRSGNPAMIIRNMRFSRHPADGRSWFRQAQIHWDHCSHGDWTFLPWHRVYLHCFEELIRSFSGDATFALPYWDWTNDPAFPALFTDPASELYLTGRSQGGKPVMSAASNGMTIMKTLINSDDWAAIYSLEPGAVATAPNPMLEAAPHGSVHVRTGGEMQAFMSPYDPIFWLHHCNIDRIWETWRAAVISRNPGIADIDLPRRQLDEWKKTPLEGFYDTAGNDFSMTPDDVLDTTALGYSYDRITLAKDSSTSAARGVSALPAGKAPGSMRLQGGQEWSDDFEYINLTASAAPGHATTLTLPAASHAAVVAAVARVTDRGDGNDTGIALDEGAAMNTTIRLLLTGVPVPSDPGIGLLAAFVGEGSDDAPSEALPGYIATFYFFGKHRTKGETAAFIADVKLPMKEALGKATASTADLAKLKLKIAFVDLDGKSAGPAGGIQAKLGYVR